VSRLLLLVPTSTYRAEAFVRAARRLPVDLSVASEEPSALSHLLPVTLPAFDFADTARAAATMGAFAERHPIDAVVAVDDQATMAAAAIARELGLRHNDPDAVYATRNKFRMRERLARAGLPTPAHHLVRVDADARAVARELRFPVVVKPLMLAASRGVVRADDPESFAEAVARAADAANAPEAPRDAEARAHVLVESFIPGWEVAVEGLLTGGRLHVMAIFDKPDPLDGPTFPETLYVTPSRFDAATQARIVAATEAAARAIGLTHGPIHAELRGDGESVHLIEIAARSIGGLCSKVLRFEGDLSLEDVILRHALGYVHAPPPLATPAAGVIMLHAPRAGRFERMDGTEAARAVDGVDEVVVSAHPGSRVEPLPAGFLYLGFIFASGDDAGGVEQALREATARVEIVIAPD
jgi:biotin carboxylase